MTRHARGVSAVDAVLEEDHTGDLRLVARREEDEPAIVAQVLARPSGGDTAGIRDHLRASRLPGYVVARQPCPSSSRRGIIRIDHQPHAIADRLELFRIECHLRLRLRRRHRLPPGSVVNGLEQVRRHARAAVGKRRHVDRHRHWRQRHRALSDADRDRLAGIPLLFLGVQPLPLGRRDQPLDFVGQIDAALHAQAEQCRPLVDLVHAHHVGNGVEVDVARLLDCVPQVDRAMAALAPALEVVPVEAGAAAAVHLEVGRDHALLEPGERHGHLER